MNARLAASPFAVAVIWIVALFSAGCGLSGPSGNKTDTFNGTLQVGGRNDHNFSSGGTGEFTVKLPSVTPDGNAILTLALGLQSGGACALTGYSAFARANNPPTPLNGPIQKGNYCLAVIDTGLLTQAENYTITVAHP